VELARRESRWQDLVDLLDQPSQSQDFDDLAMAYRGLHDWPRAERLYLRLIVERPGEAAHWHYQLARHYQLSGHPQLALDHFRAAGEDADYQAQAAAAIRELQFHSPVCVFSGYAQPLAR
jgi:hypothetical protein